MNSSDISLLSRAGAELALLLEMTTGYPDDPRRMIGANSEAVSVVADVFLRLVEEQAHVPSPVAHLVAHLQLVTNVFEPSTGAQH